MAAGEPDLDHSAHSTRSKHDGSDLEGGEGGDAELALAGKGPSAAHAGHASLHLLAAAPAATVAAAARGAYCAASTHLRALAASFGAYLARIVPAGVEVVQHVALGVAELVGTLQVGCQPARIVLHPVFEWHSLFRWQLDWSSRCKWLVVHGAARSVPAHR